MEMYVLINSSRLIQQLTELASRCGQELGPIIREEARYITESVARNTPPPTKQQGERTLSNDLNRVAVPLNYQSFERRATDGGFYKSIARYLRRRETEKLRTLLQNTKLNLFTNFSVIGSPEELHRKHYARRTFNGRVQGKPDAVTYRADMRRYYGQVKNRVGFMISGWNPALETLGVKKRAFANKAYAGSTTRVRFHFGRDPYFFTANGNIRIAQVQKMIDTALKYRMRVTQTKIERAEKRLAINLGFTSLKAGSY